MADTIISKDSKVIYNCNFCSYNTDKKANWYKHKKAHVDFKPHQCPNCPYQSKTVSNMTRHMMTHEGTKAFKCEVCDAKFNQNNNLKRHIKKQHETKSFSCGKCERYYDSLESLRQHMSTSHTAAPGVIESINKAGQVVIQCSDKSYLCNDCDKTFKTSREYQQHKKIHLSGAELLFYCEICCFITDSESRLKRHHLTHTKEKPFKCEHCSYSSNQKVHVDRHCLSKHTKPICNEKSTESNTGSCKTETVSRSEQMSSNLSTQSTANFSSQINEVTSTINEENVITKQNQVFLPQLLTSKDVDTVVNMSSEESSSNIIYMTDNSTIYVTGDIGINHVANICVINNASENTDKNINSIISNETLIDTNNLDSQVPCKPSSDQDENIRNLNSPMVEKLFEYKHSEPKYTQNKLKKCNSTATLHQSSKKKFTNQRSISKHRHHKNYRQAQKQFGCNLCSMQFHLLRSLYKHIHGQHTDYCNNMNKLRCVICSYIAINKRALYKHMRQHTFYRNNEIDSTNMIKSQYVCIECNQVLTGKRMLENHQNTCHSGGITRQTRNEQTLPGPAETDDIQCEQTVMLDTENIQMQTVVADNSVSDSENQEAVKAILNT